MQYKFQHLREMFGEKGLPDIIVSDNGKSFVYNEFKKILQKLWFMTDISSKLLEPHLIALMKRLAELFDGHFKTHYVKEKNT